MQLIEINKQGCITRYTKRDGKHSDWWVPTVIWPDGRVYYYNENRLYAISHPEPSAQTYVFYDIANKGFQALPYNFNDIKELSNNDD